MTQRTNNPLETFLAEPSTSTPSTPIRRVALLVESSRTSFAAAGLRDLTPTAALQTLEELRQAHVAHYEGTLVNKDSATHTYPELIAFDMTTFDSEELPQLGSYLSITNEVGVVYIFTRTQFEELNPGTFDVVIG